MANETLIEAPRRALSPGRGTRWLPAAFAAIVGAACGVSPLLEGFYPLATWGVIALVMLAVVTGLALAGERGPSGLAAVAVGGLVGLAVVALLSLTWAESVDQGLTAAGRWVLYAAAFGVFLAAMRLPGVARVSLLAVVAGVGALAAYLLGKMIGGDGASLFLRGRLNEPLAYTNIQALFPLLALWPLVGLAESSRPLPAGFAAAGASALASLAFLSQSRSVALAFLAAAAVVLLLVPGRQRRVWILVLLLAADAAISSPLLHVYDVGRVGNRGLDAASRDAAWWILGAAAAVGAIWGAIVANQARLAIRWPRRAGVVALGVVGLAAVIALAVNADRVGNYVGDQWRAFTALQPNNGPSRLVSGGGNRYDFWRVAAHEFADHPIAGLGAGNYTRDYFRLRRTTDDVRQPHSIEMQTLAELGLLGALALAAFVVAVGVGGVRRVRAGPAVGAQRAVLVGTIGAFTGWVVQASVDWPHLVPGATGIALLAAAYLVTTPGDPAPAPDRRIAGYALRAAVVVGAVVGAVFVGRATAAQHYLDRGKDQLAAHPLRAIRDANDALAFNPDSIGALYLKSAAFARLGDYDHSRAALLRATRLEPHNFVSWALLGDLAVRRNQIPLAVRLYRHAHRLNPRDPTIQDLIVHPRPA